MYAALLFWEQTHRTLIVSAIAVVFWIATYYIYFRYDLRAYLRRRQAGRWSVDMATKTVTAGRRPVE